MPLEDAIRLYPHTRRFEVLRVLGAGGMGVVYEARDRERKTRIALKTLRARSAEALIRFKREFRALSDIQHPNLVSLGELIEDDGQLFFTMELVQGIDFIEYVRPRGRPELGPGSSRSAEDTLARSFSSKSDPVASLSESSASGRSGPLRATMRPPVGKQPSAPPAARTTMRPPVGKQPSVPPPARATMRPPVGKDPSVPPPRLNRSSSAPPPRQSWPNAAPIAPKTLPPRQTSRPTMDASRDSPGSANRDLRTPWNWLVRNGHTFDEARLRAAFAQLARGIYALHGAQKVHRDIKPSNVLVTEEGRVVILDFGLIADVEDGERDVAMVVGTAHFMAPEQAAAKDVGPEADWYSMGSMLYLALTGYYPFQLAPEVVLDFKQCVEPTPPGLLVDGLPGDLETLCVDLLRLDPKARPVGEDVLRRLQAEEHGIEPVPLSSYASAFIGRWSELEALDQGLVDARAGTAVVALIEGESGMGKSALVRRFLEQFAGDALVLSGRCYERESVPYKAVDEIIDALSQHLDKLPREEAEALLPPSAALLANVFPVLRQVSAVAEKATEASEAKEPLEVRTQVFSALREILRRLAAKKPLVVAIDDLQWADADGLALLTEVMRPPDAPPFLLVATLRSGGEVSGIQRSPRLAFEGQVRSIQLGRLPEHEARTLAKMLLRSALHRARSSEEGAAPPSMEAIDLDAIVREAAGHPLFIDALVRHRLSRPSESAPVRLDDALWSRIQRLEAPARRLLELIAVAGGPVRQSIASHSITADFDELTRLVSALRVGNLVRTTGAGAEDFVETFHDRIRETMVSHLDETRTQTWHGRLALALEASGTTELERLAVHWEGAGDAARAAGYARSAADQAAAALAFDRAAKLYRMALTLTPTLAEEARPLLERLGDALSNAGRSSEAADVYLSAAALARGTVALELQRRAAENYLRSGYFDEGMACLRDVLNAIEMEVPETPPGTLAALLYRRTELRLRGLRFEERPAAEIAAEKLMRIDICWSAALGLGMVDHARGAYFQTRNLLLSLKAGESYRVARALALEVPFVASAGGASRARVAELLAAATRVAERTGHPHALALLPTFAGLALFFEGRFREALTSLDRGEAQLRERCANVAWERDSALSFSVFCLWFLGDLRGLARRIPTHLREAEDRGDRYLGAHLRSSFSNTYWLLRDQPEEAVHQAEDAIRSWSKAGFHLQHFHDIVARAQIYLYRGHDEAAHSYVMDRWAGLEASLHLRIQLVRGIAAHLRARTALSLAQRSPARAALIEVATKAARDLEGEGAAWLDPLAAMVHAGVAATRGDVDKALAALAKAIRGFRAAEMELFAVAAKRRYGELLGGDKGAAMAADAERWMKERGVVRPDRVTAMLAPGF
jgi:eukaryotic-like serine/threonine-protein kinase